MLSYSDLYTKYRNSEQSQFLLRKIPLLCLSILVGCASGPDRDDFQQSYSQNKARYDRIMFAWDQFHPNVGPINGKIIFQNDGAVKFQGDIANRFKQHCQSDSSPFILGDQEDRPDLKATRETVVITCAGNTQQIYAYWFTDGRFELTFGELPIGTEYLRKSLLQPKNAQTSEAASDLCRRSPEAEKLFKKYQGKLTKGKIGGYDKIKWGMCIEEIATLYPQHNEIEDGLRFNNNGIEGTVLFHQGLAYAVSIKDPADENERTRAEIIKILNNKYGKPRIVNRVTKRDISKNARNFFQWTNETNVYSDGISEIYADSCASQRDDSGLGICTLADTYTKEIQYRSKYLSDEVVKVEKTARRQQALKTGKKY